MKISTVRPEGKFFIFPMNERTALVLLTLFALAGVGLLITSAVHAGRGTGTNFPPGARWNVRTSYAVGGACLIGGWVVALGCRKAAELIPDHPSRAQQARA
jgi:hypothetical protein